MSDPLENPAINAALENLRDTIAREFAAGGSRIKRWHFYAIDVEGNHGDVGAGCTCKYCNLAIALIAGAGTKGVSRACDPKAVH